MRILLFLILGFFAFSCKDIELTTEALSPISNPTINSANITSGRLILSGSNLENITTVSPVSANLSGYTMTIENKTSSSLTIKLTHAVNNSLALAIGTVLSFSVSTASAQTTVNLTIVAAVPSGTVSAFNLASCPTGWSDYTPAEGRFIAGIDPADASQNVGDLSSGELPTVTTTLDLFTSSAANSFTPTGDPKLGVSPTGGPSSGMVYTNGETSSASSVVSGNAKPAHVLLKFCEKD